MTTSTSSAPPAPDRLSADDRREALLDVAMALVQESARHDGGLSRITMGTVAERAEVTRALVYKHFANRDELLAALHRREAARLDRVIRRTVESAPDGFEPKMRAFVAAVLEAVGVHAAFFAELRSFRSDRAYRRDQRSWDRRTHRYLAGLAADEYGLDPATARSAMGVLLAGMESLLAQVRADSGRAHRRQLEDLYLTMVAASLAELAARPTA